MFSSFLDPMFLLVIPVITTFLDYCKALFWCPCIYT